MNDATQETLGRIEGYQLQILEAVKTQTRRQDDLEQRQDGIDERTGRLEADVAQLRRWVKVLAVAVAALAGCFLAVAL